MPLIKLNNRSIKDVTSLPFGVGNMILISSQTASNSASISFTTGINSTYKEYQFYFIDINPNTDVAILKFNASTDGGSNYNVTKTTTAFDAIHSEADDAATLFYNTSHDLAQSTSDQTILRDIGNGADECAVGILQLFNPASTTYVKHFIMKGNIYQHENISLDTNIAGYLNTTSAVNAIRFQMSSGNFDGTIAMFGVL
jgi:hypothetical protein